MANFDFYLNRQGVRGPQGEQGEQGFSPIITVATDTLSEYILQIQTQNNTFQTANLREHKDDLGGTYIRYNRETGVMYAGDADVASQSQMGVVRFAAAADIERQANDCVVSPADVQDMIADVDPSGDISALNQRVSDVEEQADANTQAIFVNADAISDNKDDIDSLKDTVLALSQNKADRTDIPTVGSGIITINQGGVQKGVFNLNQTENATINLDAGGGGGSTYTEGPGIDITNNVISVDSAVVALKSDLPNMNNYYNTTQVDLMLQDKADISEVPTKTSELTNDSQFLISSDLAPYALSANLSAVATSGSYNDLINKPTLFSGSYNDLTDKPTIGNGTITFTQGGVTKGTITTNQSGDSTIALDAGGGSAPTNMVTTDTAQTITGTKTFNQSIQFANNKGVQNYNGANVISWNSGGLGMTEVGNSSSNSQVTGGTVYLMTNTLYRMNSGGRVYTILDTSNISSYALTSLPTASTTTKGGVKVDGTTITIDSNGVISSSGGGGGTTYTAGPGIDINNDVISIDDTVVASKDDLDSKQDSFESVAPLNFTQAVNVGKAYKLSDGSEFSGETITERLSILKQATSGTYETGKIPGFDATKAFSVEVCNVSFIQNFPDSYNLIEVKPGESVSRGLMYFMLRNVNNRQYVEYYNSFPSTMLHGECISDLTKEYDFKIEYDGETEISMSYKESSAISWIKLSSFATTISSGSTAQYIRVGTTYTEMPISGVKVINDNTIIFGQSNSQLSLSIGPGLSIVNGALTAPGSTPSNMVTTDTAQTITGTKTFSQYLTIGERLTLTGNYVVIANNSGNRFVAVDGTNSTVTLGESSFNLTLQGSDVNIIRNNQTYTNLDSGNVGTYALTSATGVSSTNIRTITKLTQAQYDALATKDANTFYVIVAANS